MDSVDVSNGIKIPYFRVSVTTEPGRSLLITVRHHEFFDKPWQYNTDRDCYHEYLKYEETQFKILNTFIKKSERK